MSQILSDIWQENETMAADVKDGRKAGTSENAKRRGGVASRRSATGGKAYSKKVDANMAVPKRGKLAGTGVISYFDKAGLIDLERVTGEFHITKGQLAETIGLNVAAISKADRRTAPRTQSRVREMLEIISRVSEWSGGTTQALAWYRSQPIPALDGRTAEALVKDGRAGAVRTYLDHMAVGGYA